MYLHTPAVVPVCGGAGTWVVEQHGLEKRLCEPAARHLRKQMMAGKPCPTCWKPKATHWDLSEVTS